MADLNAWNHNRHYHSILLEARPPACRRALDVGCGLGAFARRLAPLVEEVEAIDRNAAVIERARTALAPPNVKFVEGDFLNFSPTRHYDFISFIASLHHLQWVEALKKAQAILRPGGVIGIIGLFRSEPRDLLRDIAAVATSRFLRLKHGLTSDDQVPLVEPVLTFEQTRQGIEALLPGAIVRRHLLWRYSAVWEG